VFRFLEEQKEQRRGRPISRTRLWRYPIPRSGLVQEILCGSPHKISHTQLGAKSGDHHRGVKNDPSHVTSHGMSHRMGYFNFKWQVYSASATRRTYDRNTDKGEVGGSSPPRPTINPPVFMRPFSPFSGISRKAFVNDLSTSGIAICRPRRHRKHQTWRGDSRTA
jgi:hypothetical protein